MGANEAEAQNGFDENEPKKKKNPSKSEDSSNNDNNHNNNSDISSNDCQTKANGMKNL